MVDLKFDSNEMWIEVSGKYLEEFTLRKDEIRYDQYLKTLDIFGERLGEGRKEKLKLFGLFPVSMTMPSGIKCWLHLDGVEEYLIEGVKKWDKDEVLSSVTKKKNIMQFVFESGMRMLMRIEGSPRGYLKDL
ncbi:MAG: hypothetical protein A2787_09700 [Omnitrophica WOR_2 bacterium RIFCSPHIGHO2_01_FULL_48_9]|nr:MAG: hypothetical protein A3D10_07245 [Omnitrophica WOR_2 bacterium RIFCSPHIGHO2_02_FULL_48_11]OGX30009.1 MAG: hypothetical protein A2787_09700 [Omnitrophica WOR_2 bacterium RIFCSPHIGHO2_01_FULL_48_9]